MSLINKYIYFHIILLLNFLITFTITVPVTVPVHIQSIRKNESNILSMIEKWIIYEQAILDKLKIELLHIEKENQKANKTTTYFLNPINIFIFTKRLNINWLEMEDYIVKEDVLNSIKLFKIINKFPNQTDIFDTVKTLFFLQDVYNLTTASLANGEINGIKYNTRLTGKDCFHLGLTAYQLEDSYHSIYWMNEAINKLIFEPNNYIKQIALEVLNIYYHTGINMPDTVLVKLFDPISVAIQDQHKRKNYVELQNTNNHLVNKNQFYHKMLGNDANYAILCRNEFHRQPKILRTLYCHYVHNNIPFLYIGPFKKEILNFDPLVVLFHDVIYAEEVDTKLFEPLNDAKIMISLTNYTTTDRKTSKELQFGKNNEPKNFIKIVNRASHFTALNMSGFENYKVNKYEVGGFFLPHYDYLHNFGYAYDETFPANGNRMSTLIFYLNDVEQGGATIFPFIKITVLPNKGSALFFFNLHDNGEGDIRTKHAGCPILVGSKWMYVARNYEKYQETHRPCVNDI